MWVRHECTSSVSGEAGGGEVERVGVALPPHGVQERVADHALPALQLGNNALARLVDLHVFHLNTIPKERRVSHALPAHAHTTVCSYGSGGG
jgi:hypothetical protein